MKKKKKVLKVIVSDSYWWDFKTGNPASFFFFSHPSAKQWPLTQACIYTRHCPHLVIILLYQQILFDVSKDSFQIS